MFFGYIYSGKDYHNVALSLFLKTFLQVRLLKCFRSKKGKTPNVYREGKMVATEKSKQSS